MYGHAPPTLPDYIVGTSQLQVVDKILLDKASILHVLKNKLLKAQSVMNEYVDNKITPYKFIVGDLVFVKLRSYRQSYVEGKHIHKLSKRYYEPFKLVNAIREFSTKKIIKTSRVLGRFL